MEIVTSQQSCTLEQNRGVIEEELSRAILEEKKHKFQGLLYVFDQLFLPVQDANAKTRIRSSIPFQEALEYFLAFQPHHSGAPSKYQRAAFREALLHEKHGLRINVIRITEGFEYVALSPDEVDLESFLLDIFSACSTKSGHSALVLDKETLQGIVTTMDSEWDKICLRVILRSIFSREEMTALGFDPDNLPSMTERVKFVVEEVKNANEAAADLVRLRLNSKKEKLEKEIKEKENLIQKKTNIWSSKTLEEIQSELQKLKEKVKDTEGLLRSQPTESNYQRKRQMLKRQASSLIESNRLKRRKFSNQGPKPKLDEEDEDFIAKAIEDKSSYHGRRHDTVLYTGQRVKKKNLLSIANYRLAQRGKKLIQSATTVYNRARPRNKRCLQAKRHYGKGLFCWKKPPKGEENTNENTHYQRAHVKNIKRRFWGARNSSARKFCFMRSTDDKAYLRPGTSEGFDKARNLRILTLSDHTKARKLPKYDWPEKMVYVTPGSHRVFTKSSVMNETEEKLTTEDDRHYVFVRPKAIVGSSGTVWASETVRLRHEDPSAFEVDEPTPGSPQYSLGFRKCCARLHDDLFLYYDMTESDDLDKISGETGSNCKFFTYEKERAEHLKLRIDNLLQFCEDTEMSEHNRALFASQIIPVTKRILDAIDDLFKEEVDSMEKDARKDRILRVTSSCKHGLEVLGDLCLPPVKPRWADLTDAGPGVGVSNYEVRFRDAELARVHNSDYRVRCHRSRGDSGQGEAERTNSAISDALVDGATLEWEKYRRFEDLSEEEIKQLSLQSYEECEKKRMEKNAWYVCSQVAERIDDAPVLKDYIKSKVSESPDELFFFNSVYLDNYRGASERNKEQAPGAAYFRKIESFMEDHYIRGELFMEFCRDACKESREESSNLCSWCSNNRWVGPETERIPQPVPDSNNPGHFMDIYQTESTGRTPDDYLPRKCIKYLYEEHSDSIRNDQDTMKSFCSKYNVEEKHVIAYVNHLKDIEIRKDMRTRAAEERRRQETERTYKDFQWDNLIEGSKVEKLRVRELDLYLNKHALTTVGRKLDKVKAIRCHYYRQNKETVITEELSSDEDDVESEDEESESEEAESDDDYVFVDLDEQPEIGTSATIQFVSDEQISTVVVQGP